MNWTNVKDALPPENCGFILVTNNINARNAFGEMSNIWLSLMLQNQDDGSFSAFAHPTMGSKVENITHWSRAAPVASAAPSGEMPPVPMPDMDDWNVQMTCVKALLNCTDGELECTGEKLLNSYIADVQRVVAAALATIPVLEEPK